MDIPEGCVTWQMGDPEDGCPTGWVSWQMGVLTDGCPSHGASQGSHPHYKDMDLYSKTCCSPLKTHLKSLITLLTAGSGLESPWVLTR